MRKITVYSTLGKNAVEFNSQANDWKGVQAEMKEMNISFSGMKSVIGETRLTLESDRAIVPEGDFTLYLMPVKTKSGAMDRKILFQLMKDAVASGKAKKEDFMVDGKNMTQIGTAKLEELWNTFNEATASTTAPATAKAVPAKPEKKETPKNNGVADKVIAPVAASLADQSHAILLEIGEVLEDEGIETEVAEVILNKVKAIIALTVGEKTTETAPVKKESGESEEERLEKEARDKKNAELQKGAEDLMKDFSDVRR